MGIIGIQVDIYRDRLTNGQSGVFCIAGAVATLLAAYILVYLKFMVINEKGYTCVFSIIQ